MSIFLYSGPADAPATFLFAHGAGAPMDSDWMNAVAAAIGARGIRVARFEFAYMAARRDGKSKPPPSPANKLIAEYLGAIAEVEKAGRLFIGGKSLGGRMASMIAEKEFRKGSVAGLVCLGYPFHPPGSPDRLRTDHLSPLTVPTLICQGERDPFGNREEVVGYRLSASTEIFWLSDSDHDLKPRKASGLTLELHVVAVADKVDAFVRA